MTAQYSIADVAALIGEPTRAAILLALLEGGERPASELARVANLSAPATSLHLAKLTAARLLAVRKEGRHRYYRLASTMVAHALEALGVISTAPPPPRSVSPARSALRAARRCYDHLAGALSIALAEMLEREQILRIRDDRCYEVTRHGVRWFGDVMQIDIGALMRGRRSLARRCLDWTERRPHLAGALGAAVFQRAVERRWVAKVSDSRALRITIRGQAAFAELGVRAVIEAP
jgi:DNA-binding transcriptional ArsR family regulator